MLTCSALLAAGCTSAPSSETAHSGDVEFLRGCWVAKDVAGGPPTAFLRLLPDGADGSAYAGPMTNVRDGKWDVGARYEFARDGSRAVIAPTDAAAKPYPRTQSQSATSTSSTSARIAYAGEGEHLVVEGGSETLLIRRHEGGRVHIWGFERDGCD